MIVKSYKDQVQLVLRVLPEVAKETCFALHGGTAINLFIREMPRLSVDIDLTYVYLEERQLSFQHISMALNQVKSRLERSIPDVVIDHEEADLKLLIAHKGVSIKIEVNQLNRGIWGKVEKMELNDAVQVEYDAYCSINMVPFGLLFGGKICAALDRQHPRDLFDVRYLLANEGMTEDIKIGFLLCLLSSKRPINEILFPRFIDQEKAMKNKFEGMSSVRFTYNMFEQTRADLVSRVHSRISSDDIDFILKFKAIEPDWSVHNFQAFPGVKWKLMNLRKLKSTDPVKYQGQFERLKVNLEEMDKLKLI